jgi:hypothetical protein
MTTAILGSYTFVEVPTVNGAPVMLTDVNTSQISSDLFANRPAAGTVGRVFIATDTNRIYRDNGTIWVVIADGNAASIYQTLTSKITAISGTTTKTDANTTPASTDGTLVWTQAITPHFSTSKVLIHGSVQIDHSTNGRRVILALFRGTTCVGVVTNVITTTIQTKPVTISFVDSPATTAATTYTIRAWGSASGTWYLGQSSTPYYNGMLANQSIIVQELA